MDLLPGCVLGLVGFVGAPSVLVGRGVFQQGLTWVVVELGSLGWLVDGLDNVLGGCSADAARTTWAGKGQLR